MYHVVRNVASAGAIVALLACADAPAPTSASLSSSTLDTRAAASVHASLVLYDECDAETFNRNVGPGTCKRTGPGVPFNNFIATLTRLQRFPAWRITPNDLNLHVGDQFSAKNTGGEEHTFTEVAKFGGGINATLNQLSGNTVVAPECTNLAPEDFLKPGATSDVDDADTVGDELYQCCIHPWMRTVIHFHGSTSSGGDSR